MAIGHFAWQTKAPSQPALKSKGTACMAQLGDGYKQISGAGMNDETPNYEFSFTDEPEAVKGIYSSPRRRKMKSLSFTPPGGDLALWRVEADNLQRIIKSETVETVSATFEQALAP